MCLSGFSAHPFTACKVIYGMFVIISNDANCEAEV